MRKHTALFKKTNTFKLFLFVGILALSNNITQAGTTPPTTTATKDPLTPNGDYSWYVTPVTINLQATDLESGVRTLNYKIDTNDWQTITYEDTLNISPNPSFEIPSGVSNISTYGWNATLLDAETTYSRDTSFSVPGFESTSIKITSTNTAWHSIDHSEEYALTTPFNNMSAAAYIKTDTALTGANINIYMVEDEGFGPTYTYLASSPVISGTTDWTYVKVNFMVNSPSATGVYIDLGLQGSGTAWFDAVTITDSMTSATTPVIIAGDGNHTFQYYSTDRAGNIEATKSLTFKIDQTPPGNWHGSGAFRGFLGTIYQLWVYTIVDDPTSGISTFTDRYQYKTELNPTFGKYSNLLSCSSTWSENGWVILISPPFLPGVKSAYLLTPKTSFCNSNWNACKTVRFQAEDIAGNISIKDFCINGPWIKLRGEGSVRANNGIDMLSEADGDNADAIVESATTQIDFFTSTRDWLLQGYSPEPEVSYQSLSDRAGSKTSFTGTLPSSDGVYRHDGDYTLDAGDIPGTYSTSDLEQVIFIEGNLTINTNIGIRDQSAVLFVVSGDIEIEKTVTEIESGLVTDQTLFTAYNIVDGDDTEILYLKGIFVADKFKFQRTLQGTNNSDIASEDFTFEPKYGVKLRDYLGQNAIRWVSEN